MGPPKHKEPWVTNYVSSDPSYDSYLWRYDDDYWLSETIDLLQNYPGIKKNAENVDFRLRELALFPYKRFDVNKRNKTRWSFALKHWLLETSAHAACSLALGYFSKRSISMSCVKITVEAWSYRVLTLTPPANCQSDIALLSIIESEIHHTRDVLASVRSIRKADPSDDSNQHGAKINKETNQ